MFKWNIPHLSVCPVNNDSFSEVDFTKLQSATVIINSEDSELADFLRDNDVIAVRETDSITITCLSGNIVLSTRVLHIYTL